MAGPTKEAIEKVSEITKLSVGTVRSYIDKGWTFRWDAAGDFQWIPPFDINQVSNKENN